MNGRKRMKTMTHGQWSISLWIIQQKRFDFTIRCFTPPSLLVRNPVQISGEVKSMSLPERDYAVLRHTGPYDQLSDAYAWLCGVWLPRSGREAASAPPLEFYRNHPPQTPPEQLITDIHLPLEPA